MNAPVVAPLEAPPVNVAVPSVNVGDVTLVKPVKSNGSKLTVSVLLLPTVPSLVPPAMSKVSLSKSMLSAPPRSPWKSKSLAVSCGSTYAFTIDWNRVAHYQAPCCLLHQQRL